MWQVGDSINKLPGFWPMLLERCLSQGQKKLPSLHGHVLEQIFSRVQYKKASLYLLLVKISPSSSHTE